MKLIHNAYAINALGCKSRSCLRVLATACHSAHMRTTHLRQADLNLLVVFATVAEERHISRAATRLGMTQPAVSRALQRAREMFDDDLLVRTGATFEPTPLGYRLLGELESILPRLDNLLSGKSFDPTEEELLFRLVATDYAAMLCSAPLYRTCAKPANKVRFEFTPKSDFPYQDLERGRVDLVLGVDDGKAPAHLQSEFLWQEDFVCVVAAEQPFEEKLTLEEYLQLEHVQVTGAQSLVERSLSLQGEKRTFALTVPYFTAAIRAVTGTNLIATVAHRLADYEAKRPGLGSFQLPPRSEPIST